MLKATSPALMKSFVFAVRGTAIVSLLVAWFAASPAAQASVLITIDKGAQNMSVDVNGEQRWSWPVSTGRDGYATPSGSFKPFRMEPTHFSKEWDDAPMPHSMFFTKVGHAIHGTYDVAHLGQAVSHGCVRLSAANAGKLYALVKAEGMGNTQVVITGTQPSGAPDSYQMSRTQGGYEQNNYQNNYQQNNYQQSYQTSYQSNYQNNYQSNYHDGFFGSGSYEQGYGQSEPPQGKPGRRVKGQAANGQSANGQAANGQSPNRQSADRQSNEYQNGGWSFFGPRN
jgi:hypothetical protein